MNDINFREVEIQEKEGNFNNIFSSLNEFEIETFNNLKHYDKKILIKNILENFLDVSKMEICFLFLKIKGKLVSRFGIDENRKIIKKIEFSKTLLKKAENSREPLFLEEIKSMSESTFELSIKKAVLIPLITDEKIIGILYADYRSDDSIHNEISTTNKTILTYIGKKISNYLNLYEEYTDLNLKISSLEKQTELIFPEIIGESRGINKVFKIIEILSGNESNVLITGETGVGKGLVAKAIHQRYYKDCPFIHINCSNIPSELFENELFGHVKGGFTGAKIKKIGQIELANNGVLFLDEIGEIPFNFQSKLLHVIEDKKFVPIGGEKEVKVNTKIISATNCDLEQRIKQNLFRKDLYYRLNIIPIYIPSLEERKSDIIILINYFIKKFSKENNKNINSISPIALNYLQKKKWEGNIRELKNLIQRAIICCNTNEINLNHIYMFNKYDNSEKTLEESIFDKENLNLKTFVDFKETVNKKLKNKKEELILDYIKTIIKLSNGNISKASKKYRISRQTIYTVLNKE